jgi:hypothetical protein
VGAWSAAGEDVDEDPQSEGEQALSDALHESAKRLGEVVIEAHLALEVAEHALDDEADAGFGDLAIRSRRWRASFRRSSGVPLSRGSVAEIARAAPQRGIVAQVSGVTVWRWLAEDAIRPWNYRSWIFPFHLRFAERAGPILDLYEGRWQGELLERGHVVVCAEREALDPGAPARPPDPADSGRAPGRAGVRAPGRAVLPGRLGCAARADLRPLRAQGRHRALRRADRAVHERRALRVGPARLRDRRQRLRAPRQALDRPPPGRLEEPDPRPHPSPRLVADQAEIYFAVTQRKVLQPSNFTDLAERTLLAFARHYEQIAQPFKWKFTRADLSTNSWHRSTSPPRYSWPPDPRRPSTNLRRRPPS